ncbi:MAG TPA: DUF3179 domain-containing protein [Thermoanaerobaculia bacterium]|nr:DUF3179 domain-containing protein [Thermoanaerobaculia bacterium]
MRHSKERPLRPGAAPAALVFVLGLASVAALVGGRPADGGGATLSTAPPDPRLAAALHQLIDADPATTAELLAGPVAHRDRRYVAPLIELLRPTPGAKRAEVAKALAALTGETLGNGWQDWVEWLGERRDVPLPAELATWKGDLYARFIDRRFKRFLDSRRPSRLRIELVEWGGVKVDGIPALDGPKLIDAAAATYLTPGDEVFGVSILGDARAYPLRILDWHEIVNDVVGGMPVSLTYCALCGSGVLYRTTVSGTTYSFGTSGLLYESNKLMYDRQTESLWNQLTGEAVNGPLASRRLELERLPVVVTSWKSWLAENPGTRVLSPATGFERDYAPGRAYGNYAASPYTMFPVARRSQALPAKSRVFAIVVDGAAKAYPLDRLATRPVVHDTLSGHAVLVVREPGSEAVRAYDPGNHTFLPELSSDGGSLRLREEATRASWRLLEEGLVGPAGETLPRLPGHLAYWFGWFSFFPSTLIYGVDPASPGPATHSESITGSPSRSAGPRLPDRQADAGC